MIFKASLRFRVMLSFALLGVATSSGLAGVLYVLTIQMEERLIAETLSVELEDYIGRFSLDPDTPPPSSTVIRSFVQVPGKVETMPGELSGLQPGLHRINLNGIQYFAEVRNRDDVQFAVLYNDAQIRHREAQFRLFLVGGVVTMTLLSTFLGWWLARRVTYPVSELARRVAALSPGAGELALAEEFPGDEVGELARDFDDYQQRLAEFIERERAFTGDVSHELRTPLAVINGAAEVLLADTRLNEKERRVVERIARAAREASELTAALLLLAREEDGKAITVSECKVEDILKQVIEGHRQSLCRKSVYTELKIEGHPVLVVEPELLRVVLGNLVRNAFAYTREGSVIIAVQADSVSITDSGVGMTASELARAFDRHYSGGGKGGAGIGLSIVKRICQRYGWVIKIASESGAGTTVRLSFNNVELSHTRNHSG